MLLDEESQILPLIIKAASPPQIKTTEDALDRYAFGIFCNLENGTKIRLFQIPSIHTEAKLILLIEKAGDIYCKIFNIESNREYPFVLYNDFSVIKEHPLLNKAEIEEVQRKFGIPDGPLAIREKEIPQPAEKRRRY